MLRLIGNEDSKPPTQRQIEFHLNVIQVHFHSTIPPPNVGQL